VGALLVGEQHQLTVAKPRLEASVVQQHQRQQSMHLGLIGHQLGQRPSESQGFGGELAPGGRDRVPLVEDQVHDRDHGAQPLRQQMVGWHPERDPGGLDLALGPDQPLGHRRLSDQEGVRDLSGAQAAERPQGEGDLSVGGERRMAAGEDELESLIGDDGLVHRVLHRLGHREQARLLHQSAIAANPVDGAVARGAHQPGDGVLGRSVARPALGGDRERLLHGLLGEVEVAEEADQCSEDLSAVLAEGLFEDGYHPPIGRTSIAPPMRAAGIRDASSIAASRSSAS
jgi:hypothetical protein